MELVFQTQSLIAWGGVLLILLLIFAETGLLLGLVVPGGETLVFTSGFLVSTGTLNISILPFFLLMVLAAFLGDVLGYLIGKKLGPKLYNKRDTWYFKKRYLLLTQDYMTRHKKKSILLGKFFPVIRPFIPVLAGITGLNKASYFPLSFLSVVIYLSTFLFAGYLLGNRFPELKNYLGFILPASVIILLIPVIVQFRKGHRGTTTKNAFHKQEGQITNGS